MNDFFSNMLSYVFFFEELVKRNSLLVLIGMLIWLLLLFSYFTISFLIIKRKFEYRNYFLLIHFFSILLLIFDFSLIEIAQLSLFFDAFVAIVFINKKAMKIVSILYICIMLILSGLNNFNYYIKRPYAETVLNKIIWNLGDNLNSYLYKINQINETDAQGRNEFGHPINQPINEYFLLNIHTKNLNTVHNYLFDGKVEGIEDKKEDLIIILNWIFINDRYAKYGFIPSKEDILDILKEKPIKLEKINEQEYEFYLQVIKNSEFVNHKFK